MVGSISEGPLHPDLPPARSILILQIEPQGEVWTVRGPGPVVPTRIVPSPSGDPTFVGLLRELWEWTGRPVNCRDPQTRSLEDYLDRLARRIGAQLTEALLPEEIRAELARHLREEGSPPQRLTLQVEGRSSEVDTVLALPWELLAPEPGRFPVREGRLDLVREAVVDGAPELPEPSGSLMVAVSIAAPEDRAVLSYEEEAFRLQAALSALGQRAAFADLGSARDLVELAKQVAPTAIHFSGHGLPGRLVFEDGLGFADEIPVEELMRRLRTVLLDPGQPGSFPRLFFLSSCHRLRGDRDKNTHLEDGQGPITAAALHRAGFPQVIGWSGPVDGDLRSRMEDAFYSSLAAGKSGVDAAREARATLGLPVEAGGSRIYPLGWVQLALYLRGTDRPLAVMGSGTIPLQQLRRAVEVSGLPVLEQGFIGRRTQQHEVRRRVELEGRRLIVFQGLGGLGKTALASHLLVRVFAPEPADQLILRCRDLEDTAADPILELRAQAEEHGRLQAFPFWDERVKDLRERISDPAKGLAAVVRALREKRPDLVLYIDNAESLQIGPATDDPGALGSWRPGADTWWSEMERLAVENGCLVLASTRYAWEGLSPRAHLGVDPMSPADSRRLIDSFDALQDLPPEARARLADRVDGHPRTVELLDRLVARRREELAGQAIVDPWRELIVPILPVQEEKIRADLLLPELWKRLSEEARQHARKLTVLRRSAPQFVIDRIGGARDELIRAGWLTRYRETVLTDKGLSWQDFWGMHSQIRAFLITQIGEVDVRKAHELAAAAYEQALEHPVFLRSDQGEAIYHLCEVGEGDRAWPIIRDYVVWLRQEARFREAHNLLEGCEVAGTSGEHLALALLLLAQMKSSLGDRGESLLALLERAETLAASAESQGGILQERGDLLIELGRYEEAETLLRKALELDKEAFGFDHPAYSSSLHALAMALDRLGKHEEAEQLLREAVDRLGRVQGPDHVFLGASLHALAGALEHQGRYGEAEVLLRRSLEIHEKKLDIEHPDYAASLHLLALVLRHQAKYQEAEGLLRRSLEIVERSLGAEHPSCASTLHTLAATLQLQGKFEEAEQQLRRALHLTEASLGKDHPEYGTTLQLLAIVLVDQGSYAEAEKILRDSLALKERLLGERHPDLLPSLQALGNVLREQGRYRQAEEVLRCAANLAQETLGPVHPHYGSILHTLALVLENLGEYKPAEDLLRQALVIDENNFGLEHPSSAATLLALAQTLERQDNLQEAEELLRRSLKIDERYLGQDHPSCGTTLHELALVLERQGRTAEAEDLLRRSLALQAETLSPDHPSLAPTLTNLAALLAEHGEPEDAEEGEALLQRALRIANASLGNDGPDVAQILANLAEIQALLDRAEAPETARQALAALNATLGPEHPTTQSFTPLLREISRADDPEAPDFFVSPDELVTLESAVAQARSAGEAAAARAELRDRLYDLSGGLLDARLFEAAAAALEEVVALDRELALPALKWDQRELEKIKALADLSPTEPHEQ